MKAFPMLWVLSLALGCGCSQPDAPNVAPGFMLENERITLHSEASPVSFATSVATLGQSLPRPSVTARVAPVEALTAKSFAPLDGHVVESRVHLGDRVKKGQKLVLVRTAELSLLERERRSAELSVHAKTGLVARLTSLVDARAGSEHDLLLARNELDEAKLSLGAARSRLNSLQIARVDDTSYWVLATRDGTVVELNAAPGLEVGPSRGLAVAVVSDLTQVLVVGDVPQQLAAELEAGMKALVQVSRSLTVPASIESVSDVVDLERQTVPVRVRAENSAHKLRPNAYVELSFQTSSSDGVLLLPTSCIVRDGKRAVVFVEEKAGSFVRREVALGQEGRDMVEVLSGIAPGERAVSSGALLLLHALITRASS